MTNPSLLCKTKDNFEVYYDPINSHAATHFNDAPNLKELVIELLEGLETGGKEIAVLGLARLVGTTNHSPWRRMQHLEASNSGANMPLYGEVRALSLKA